MTEEKRPSKQFPDRKNSLTEHDIEDIISAIESRQNHACRFKGVSEEDFYESVKFFKNLNNNFNSGKNIAGKTILILTITFLFGATGLGVLAVILEKIKVK